MPGQADGIQIQNQREAAAKEGEDQRIRHRTDHVTPDVHARPEELAAVQGRVDRVYLGKRRGKAHGYVHYGAERADQNPSHKQAPQLQRGALVAELEQRFHVGDTQPVNLCDCLGKQAEQQRNCQAEDGSKHGAGRLAADAA